MRQPMRDDRTDGEQNAEILQALCAAGEKAERGSVSTTAKNVARDENGNITMLDVPIMIRRIQREGLTIVKLAEKIGVNKNSLQSIASEAYPIPEQWIQAYRLLDIYLKYVQRNPPIYGEHNE